MNRPRESVLSLFDPLAGSSATSPRRDVHTPDSGSDKENALSPPPSDSSITLTKFFSRTYTRYKTLPAKLPKGGLIDFGDLTIDEDTDLDQLGSTDDAENYSDADENAGTEQHIADATPQRRPLADIAIDEDDDNTPIAMKRGPSVFAKPDDSLQAPNFSQLRPTAAPLTSPLAAVINSINGMPSSPTSSTSSIAPGSPSATPRISIIPPEPSSPSPKPKPRPVTSASTSSLDPRRISVDLQSSFSMHFNCPEASFDLMHDKISLGNETFLGTMDDSFDLAAEEATMNALAQRLENVNLKEKSAVKKRAAQRKIQMDSESESETELQENSLVERIRDIRLTVSESESEDDTAPRKITLMTKRGASSKSAEGMPQAPLTQQLLLTSKPASPLLPPPGSTKPTELVVPAKAVEDIPITPKNLHPPSKTEPPRLPPPPAAIRALSIKKKTISRPSITSRPSSISSRPSTITARPSSISSASTTSGSGSSSTRASVTTSSSSMPDVGPKPTQAAPRPVRPRTVVTGVQRPPAGAALPARSKDIGSTMGLRGHAAMPSESRRDGASATTSKYIGSMGRAAASRVVGAGVQRPDAVLSKVEASKEPSVSRLQRTVSVSAGLSRKTSVSASVTAGPAKATARSATSGLRPPSRIGGPTGGVSSHSRTAAAAKPPVPTVSGTSSSAIARSLRGEGRFGMRRV